MPSHEAPFGASPVGPSRRQVLAGAGLLATAGVAELIPIGGIEGWTPAPDTWPLARYDLANTASTDATPPEDPSVSWSSDVLGREDRTTLAAGPERVYAGGEGIVALSRVDGHEVWSHEEVASGRLVLHEGTLYSAVADEILGFGFDLLTVDAEGGERGWRAELPFEATSLLLAGGCVFVGYDGGVLGVDADTGWRRWRRDSGSANGTFLAVHGGDLYTADDLGSVTRFAGRDLLDVPLRSGPDVRWTSESPVDDAFGSPVVTDTHVYARQRSYDRPALVAVHRPSGEVAWTAVADAPDADRALGATSLAVDGERGGVAGIARDAGDTGWRHEVVGFDPADGTLLWRDDFGARRISTVAVAADLALVGTANAGPTVGVRAFDLDSGVERWRVDLPSDVVGIAPVEGTTFVACRDGSVHALRD